MAGKARGEHLNDQIVDAAVELIGKDGFQGATADDIAETAGVTKRTLYRRMISKENILFEIHERFLRGLRESLDRIDASDGVGRLRAILYVHLKTIADNQGPIRIFYEEMKHLEERNRQAVLRERDEYWNLVQQILREEIARGTLRDLDVPIVAHGILGAVNDAYRWFRPGGDLDAAEIADLGATFFLDGLMSEAATVVFAGEEPASAPPDRDDMWSTDPTKARILDAATDLFARLGYPATPTREIADVAGIAKAALFYHIGTKEEVLYQIVKRVNGDGTAAIKRVIDKGLPPLETFVQMCVVHATETARHRNAIAVFSDDMRYLGPEKRAELIAERRGYTDMWARVIAQGQREGVFRIGNNSLTVRFVMGALTGIYRWYQPGSRLTAAQIGNTLAELFLIGVRRPGQAERDVPQDASVVFLPPAGMN